MKKMTQENVGSALAGESQAHIKYLAFSEKAAEEDLPNVARIFKADRKSTRLNSSHS